MGLEIEYINVGDVKRAEYNPRAMTPQAFDGLKHSIKRFSLLSPLVINKRTGNLVGGHQRLDASIELGETSVPVIYVDLDIIEEKALNVTLNNPAISGYFTTDIDRILDEIKLSAADIEIDYDALKFDDVRYPNGWADPTDEIDKINSDFNELPVIIKIRCHKSVHDIIIKGIEKFIVDNELKDVEID